MFENLFGLGWENQLSVGLVLFNMVLATILSILAAITYRITHKGLSYSQSFTFSLVLIGLLMSVIITAIGSSLAAAFGAFGAFSIIRFRAAIKDPKDISFILLALAIGLSVGTGNYVLALVSTIFILVLIYYMSKMNFGTIRKYDYVLTFSADTASFSNEKMRDLFKEYLRADGLLNVVSRENGKVLDYTFNVRFFKAETISEFISKLSALSGISDVNVITAKNDIEY